MNAAEIAALVPIAGGLYFVSVVFAATGSNCDMSDAFWWPIYLFKALIKSLYRALFTGWQP